MDCGPPGSSVRGTLQARILEWVAIPSPGLPTPGIELRSPALQAGSLPSEPPGKPLSYWLGSHQGKSFPAGQTPSRGHTRCVDLPVACTPPICAAIVVGSGLNFWRSCPCHLSGRGTGPWGVHSRGSGEMGCWAQVLWAREQGQGCPEPVCTSTLCLDPGAFCRH